MPRIICISDCHGQYPTLKVPDGDILIDSGDWTAEDSHDSVRDYLIWFAAHPHEHKVLICGNHQTFVEANPEAFAALLAEFAPSVTYLHDSGVTIAGLKIWGSPYQPEFCDWAFNVARGPAIQKHWDKIPSDTELLITHGPPLGTLDVTAYGSGGHYGCGNLATTIRERLKSLRCHIFGHMHANYGIIVSDSVYYVNASVVNERYVLTNAPIIINL